MLKSRMAAYANSTQMISTGLGVDGPFAFRPARLFAAGSRVGEACPPARSRSQIGGLREIRGARAVDHTAAPQSAAGGGPLRNLAGKLP